MLKKLAHRARIKLTGKIRSHEIRVWTINSLIKAGFSQPEWKYVCGKSIGLSDDTYMRLKPIVAEKYQQVYEKYLNIMPSKIVVSDQKAEQLIRAKNAEIKALREQVEALSRTMSMVTANLTVLMEDFKDRRGPQTKPKG